MLPTVEYDWVVVKVDYPQNTGLTFLYPVVVSVCSNEMLLLQCVHSVVRLYYLGPCICPARKMSLCLGHHGHVQPTGTTV